MIRWFKRWRHRRDIIRRLVAYAKTPEGRIFIEKINEENAIMADWEAEILGATMPTNTIIRTRMPAPTWRILNLPNTNEHP